MTAKTVLAFRIRPELRKTLARLAKKDRRTVSQYIENALEDHVVRSTAPERVKESQ